MKLSKADFSFTKKEILVIRSALHHFICDLQGDGITDEGIIEEQMSISEDLTSKMSRALLWKIK